MQFLGSEAADDGTWMWGWNNINGFPASLLEGVRAIGQQWGLEELTTATFPLSEDVAGRHLATVSTALAPGCLLEPGSFSLYRGPHSGGAVFLAFSGLPETVFAPVNVLRFTRVLSECVMVPCDHRILTESFLAWNGTAYEWQGNRIVAHFPHELTVDFDEHWRIVRLATT